MSNISVIDTFTATFPGSSVSRNGLSFGADTPERLIVVTFVFRASSARTVSSVTIGGVTATLAKDTLSGGSDLQAVCIYYARVSGTSGDVVVSMSGVLQSYSAAVYALSVSSSSPVDVNAVANTIGTPTTLPVSLNEGDILVEAIWINAGSGSITDSYDGVDAVVDDINQVALQLRVHSHMESTETESRNIGYAGAASASNKYMALATWSGAASAPSPAVNFRRSLSPIGGRTGARQAVRW